MTITPAGTAPPATPVVMAATVAPSTFKTVKELADTRAGRNKAAGTGFNLDAIKRDTAPLSDLWWILPTALLGGFVLNFMPCVLPVIGLKVMSFVEQAGHDRGRSFALNAAYSIGVFLVFMFFGSLIALKDVVPGLENFSWGTQQSIPAFGVVMATIVFAMALSFIGVWDIPIPGFVGGSGMAKVARKEGLSAAMVKGVITTLIAIPCTGPGVAAAFSFTAGQPALVVLLVFAMMALGMSLPYLLIGAFPKLLRFLPRPGAWMETFKHVMGFVLLGTVVYLIAILPLEYRLPMFALLFVTWFALWIVGQAQYSGSSVKVWSGWTAAAAMIVLVSVYAFKSGDFVTIPAWALLGQNTDPIPVASLRSSEQVSIAQAATNFDRERGQELIVRSAPGNGTEPGLAWEPFSVARLKQEVDSGNVVMVDFTATWCPTCHALEANVLNTTAVRGALDKNKVVILRADWTNQDPEITKLLEGLVGRASIPALAIFSPSAPNKPFVRTSYGQIDVVTALNQAGSGNQTLGGTTTVAEVISPEVSSANVATR